MARGEKGISVGGGLIGGFVGEGMGCVAVGHRALEVAFVKGDSGRLLKLRGFVQEDFGLVFDEVRTALFFLINKNVDIFFFNTDVDLTRCSMVLTVLEVFYLFDVFACLFICLFVM